MFYETSNQGEHDMRGLGTSDELELYVVNGKLITLRGRTKIEIMRLIRSGVRSFEDLVKTTGLAKSTVSTHLRRLVELGLLEERRDPRDRRKKILIPKGLFLGISFKSIEAHYQRVLDSIEEFAKNPDRFALALYRALRYGLEYYGLQVDPVIRSIGRDIGRALAKTFRSSDLEEILRELEELWREAGLGLIRIVRIEPEIELEISDCYSCGGMPNVGKALCPLDEGIIEGILEERIGGGFRVREVECYGKGNERCLFKIRIEGGKISKEV